MSEGNLRAVENIRFLVPYLYALFLFALDLGVVGMILIILGRKNKSKNSIKYKTEEKS